ncbi:MAG: sodium:solute symporter family protein [Chloroherpetonaceae bacterium]|nr:sodium:solute symporter family protein [Chloroherpetonaceae bacterium]
MNWILFGIVTYVALQIVIGFWASRSISTEDDYLLAGRKFGYGLSIFSIFATWFGAETCIGSSGRIFQEGIFGGLADPIGYGLCIFFMGLVFAVPLWKKQLTTLVDLFRIRFSENTERLAALLMAPTSMLWAAAQIRAFGQVIAFVSNFSVDIAISFAAIVVIIYTVSGGLMADAVTDIIQGGMLILGLIIIFVALVMNSQLQSGFSQIHPEKFLLVSEKHSTMDLLEALAIPLVGSMVVQELVARTLAAKSPRVAKNSALIASGVYFLVGLIPAIIGLIGFSLVPEGTEPEQVLSTVAKSVLSPLLFILFTGALVSAILSTVDSALLASGAILSHNLVLRVFPHKSEELKLRWTRMLVILSGVIAYLLALTGGSVYELAESTSGFSSAGIFTITVFGLFSAFGSERAAITSLIVGTLLWLVGSSSLGWSYPYLISLLGAVVSYLLIGWLEKNGSTSLRRYKR